MKNVLVAILSISLFVGGLLIIGYAFAAPGMEAPIFFGGVLCVTLAFLIPIVIVPALER
jgi:hypothetical protein